MAFLLNHFDRTSCSAADPKAKYDRYNSNKDRTGHKYEQNTLIRHDVSPPRNLRPPFLGLISADVFGDKISHRWKQDTAIRQMGESALACNAHCDTSQAVF